MAQPSPRRGIRPIVRRAAAALVAAALPLGLAGCATFDAESQRVYEPVMGVSGGLAGLKLRNVVAVAESEGQAALVATIVNSGRADTLVGVTFPEGQARLDPTRVRVGDGEALRFGSDEPGAATASLTGPRLVPGRLVPMTFEFANAGPLELEVHVVRQAGVFAEVPVPVATQEPAHTPTDPTGEAEEQAPGAGETPGEEQAGDGPDATPDGGADDSEADVATDEAAAGSPA